jgi:hypothetical protein
MELESIPIAAALAANDPASAAAQRLDLHRDFPLTRESAPYQHCFGHAVPTRR